MIENNNHEFTNDLHSNAKIKINQPCNLYFYITTEEPSLTVKIKK